MSESRRNWMIAGLVFVASLALRVPFRSHYAYHWDGAQFALAVENYDLRLGQPHAPGYFLYVLLGRLVNLLVGDPHGSLVWLSVVAGAALATLGFFLATAMYGRACGVAAGAILATSPLCWFHSEIALTTIVDSALVTATMLAGWHARHRGGRWRDVILLAFLLAWVAGNRPQTAVALLPAWLFVFAKFDPCPAKLLVGIVLTVLLCLLWFVPMTWTSGGWREYFHLLEWKLQFDAPKTILGGGVLASLVVILRSCWTGLLAAALIAIVGWPHRVLGARGAAALLAWWIIPMVMFGLLSYTTMPGYVLCYFPALAILVARVCTRWFLVVVVAITNAVVFLGNVPVGLPLSAREIRSHDDQLERACAAIRARYRPENVWLCHRQEFFLWGLRHFQYHLPEFSNALLGRDLSLPAERAGMFRVCRGAHTEFVDDWREAARGRTLLLVVPPENRVTLFADRVNATNAVPVVDGVYELRP
jgi:hypothetical protein